MEVRATCRSPSSFLGFEKFQESGILTKVDPVGVVQDMLTGDLFPLKTAPQLKESCGVVSRQSESAGEIVTLGSQGNRAASRFKRFLEKLSILRLASTFGQSS